MKKYHAYKAFFQSTMLLLAMDGCEMDKVVQNLKEIMVIDPMFKVSPGCDFLTNILSILQNISSRGAEASLHTFSDHLYDYDKFYPFDLCNLEILDKIHTTHFQEYRKNDGLS